MYKLLIIALLVLLSVARCAEFQYEESIENSISRVQILTGRPIPRFIPIEFTDLDPPVVGLCSLPGDIWLDKDTWAHSPDCMRDLILLHEVGHCAYGLGHWESGVMAPRLEVIRFCSNSKPMIDEFLKKTQ